MSDGSPKLLSARRSKDGTSGSIALASRIATGPERTKRPDLSGKGESRNGTIQNFNEFSGSFFGGGECPECGGARSGRS
jgi:hypothetical protein